MLISSSELELGKVRCCFGLWNFHSWKLLTSQNEAVAVWLVEFSGANVTKALKEAVADPTWILPTIATIYVVT